MFFRTLGLVALSVTLTACKISGTAQKGPFKEGSDVSASQLDDQAMPISTTTLTTQMKTMGSVPLNYYNIFFDLA